MKINGISLEPLHLLKAKAAILGPFPPAADQDLANSFGDDPNLKT